jgi:COP9 signalosome complex subunit 1
MYTDADYDTMITESGPYDPPENTKAKKPVLKEPILDGRHPFDLEAYISNYTGRTAIARLLFIAKASSFLAPQAYRLAAERLFQSQDVSTYVATVQAYNALSSVPSKLTLDQAWVDKKNTENSGIKEKLEVELKTYSSNMIKESVRMAHRDLGNYYRTVGDFQSALRHYQKTREYCSTGQQVLEHCLNVLEVLLEQNNYAQISTFVFKAESALDMPGPGASKDAKKPAAGSTAAPNAEREKIQTKLELCSALSNMAQGHYDSAAYGFLKLKRDLGDWQNKLIAPGDIAVYGTLCALASLSRSAIKASVIESDTFGYFLEQEPYMRELIDAYMSSRFKTVLELLEKYSTRHSLDIHLMVHVLEINQLIRNRSLVLYFQPFTTVRLDKMAQAFGLALPELEALVVSLIQEGQIKARIDSQNKTLKATEHDPRIALYNRVIKAGADAQNNTRKVLLRMKLLQADLVVKAPRQQHGSQHESMAMLE